MVIISGFVGKGGKVCAVSVVALKNIALEAPLLMVLATEQCWLFVDTV